MSSAGTKKEYIGQTNFSVHISDNTEVVVEKTEDGKIVHIFSPIFFEGQCTIRESVFKYTFIYKAKLAPRIAKSSLDKFPKTLTEEMQKAYSKYIQRMSESYYKETVDFKSRNGLPAPSPRPIFDQDPNADIICTIESYELV